MKKFIVIVLVSLSLVTCNISYAEEEVTQSDPMFDAIDKEIEVEPASSVVIEDILSHYSVVDTEAQLEPLQPEVDQKELNCMAQNIYFEAGNESRKGMLAVAQVTLNRIESGLFPDSVCGVVQQKTRAKATGRTVCQFSWYCEGKKQVKYESKRWLTALEVAWSVLAEGMRLESLADAMFYHNTQVNPRWGLRRITKIGGHIFYSKHKIK